VIRAFLFGKNSWFSDCTPNKRTLATLPEDEPLAMVDLLSLIERYLICKEKGSSNCNAFGGSADSGKSIALNTLVHMLELQLQSYFFGIPA